MTPMLEGLSLATPKIATKVHDMVMGDGQRSCIASAVGKESIPFL